MPSRLPRHALPVEVVDHERQQRANSRHLKQQLRFMRRERAAVELRLMVAVKSALDPNGLMNPGKVLG